MDRANLVGVWFRAFEEDEEGRRVYRDQSYDFPLSRAPRPSLSLEPDGTVRFGRPGAADNTAYATGSWNLEDHVLTLSASGRQEVWEVESLEEGRLVLRPLDREERDGEG